jgi:hypothetical protein
VLIAVVGQNKILFSAFIAICEKKVVHLHDKSKEFFSLIYDVYKEDIYSYIIVRNMFIGDGTRVSL